MQLDIAVTGAQRIAAGTTGELRIGVAWNTSGFFIPAAAREFHRRHPGLLVDFVELPAREHTQAIQAQKIDVGFVSGHLLTSQKDIDCRLIYSCAIKAILPSGHPMAHKTEVRLRDLKQERWIAIEEEETPGARILLAHRMRPAQFTPRVGRCARSFQGLLALIGAGEGIGLIPELFLPAEPIGLHYVGTDSAPFEMFAVWRKDQAELQVTAYLEILRGIVGTARIRPTGPSRPPDRFAPQPRILRSKYSEESAVCAAAV